MGYWTEKAEEEGQRFTNKQAMFETAKSQLAGLPCLEDGETITLKTRPDQSQPPVIVLAEHRAARLLAAIEGQGKLFSQSSTARRDRKIIHPSSGCKMKEDPAPKKPTGTDLGIQILFCTRAPWNCSPVKTKSLP